MITEKAAAPLRDYEDFVIGDGARLRRLLVAHFGVEIGPDVHADALAYAWEHWADIAAMASPVGYLYRVAQSNARRHRRWGRRPAFPPETLAGPTDPEPGLGPALARLRIEQRVAVLLVHAHGWSYAEVADALDVPITTVRNHVHRGMTKLRAELGADHDQ